MQPAVRYGRFCPACYGGVLHPEGKPMEPGNPNDPWRDFNAEADAFILDQQMPEPKAVAGRIAWEDYRRSIRRYDD